MLVHKCHCGGRLFLHTFKLIYISSRTMLASDQTIPINRSGFSLFDDPDFPCKYEDKKYDLSTDEETVKCSDCGEVWPLMTTETLEAFMENNRE